MKSMIKTMLSVGMLVVGIGSAWATEGSGDDWVKIGCDPKDQSCQCEPGTLGCYPLYEVM